MKRNQQLRNEASPEGGDAGGGAAATATPPAAAPAAAATPPAAGTPAAPAPPASPFNPDGSFADGWQNSLGDEFTPHSTALAQFKDAKSLAKSYLHFRTTGAQYPDEQTRPEDVDRFRALAKVPVEGTPTGYGLQIPEGISPEEKGLYDRVAAIAHKHHAPAPAVAAIVAEYQAIQGEVITQDEQRQAGERKAAEDALVAKWGGKFEENKGIARHMITTLASQAGITQEDPSFAALLNNPAMAQMAVEFAKLTGEDRTRLPAGFGDIRSPQQKITSIMDGSDPVWGKRYTEGTRDEQLAAYEEVKRLQNEGRA
jgi:hypothetical protein